MSTKNHQTPAQENQIYLARVRIASVPLMEAEIERLRRERDDLKSFCKGVARNIDAMLEPVTPKETDNA